MNNYNDRPEDGGQPDPNRTTGGTGYPPTARGGNPYGAPAAPPPAIPPAPRGYGSQQQQQQQEGQPFQPPIPPAPRVAPPVPPTPRNAPPAEGGLSPYYNYGGAPTPPPNEPYRWDYDSYESHQKQPKRQNRGLVAFVAALIGTLLLGVVVVSVVSLWNIGGLPADSSSVIAEPDDGALNGTSSGITPAVRPREDLVIPPSGELLTIPQVAAKVTPSVVGILRYENTLYEPTGIGSGFIVEVDSEGYAYVITNAHVVEYGSNFKVRLFDGTDVDAKLVGADKQTDVAVLRMKPESKVTAAEIGDSDALLVGETVVAIGNPVSFELSGSVTQGIVSALDRQLSTENSVNYIQIDAAINPGNSGGALVNQYGQVVGINTMKISGAGYEGIGFAIPMSTALPIVQELQEHGKVASRPVLGIEGKVISEVEAKQLECPVGIMVMGVDPNAKFDPLIEEMDIITHASGTRILALSDLRTVLGEHKIGDEIELTVYRKLDTVASEELTVRVILIESQE